jgi:hypothetical protein
MDQRELLAMLAKSFPNLFRQLSSRTQYERTDMLPPGLEELKQGQPKCGGFSRTRSRSSDDVAPLENRGHGGGLDGSRRLKPHLVELSDKSLVKTELLKGDRGIVCLLVFHGVPGPSVDVPISEARRKTWGLMAHTAFHDQQNPEH